MKETEPMSLIDRLEITVERANYQRVNVIAGLRACFNDLQEAAEKFEATLAALESGVERFETERYTVAYPALSCRWCEGDVENCHGDHPAIMPLDGVTLKLTEVTAAVTKAALEWRGADQVLEAVYALSDELDIEAVLPESLRVTRGE